jgi:enediyne biosynthesis protein E4
MRLFAFISFVFVSLSMTAQVSFTDISEIAGLQTGTLNHRLALGDYNGDGWEDIYVATKAGDNKLFRNNGDLTFSDVTNSAGVNDFSASYCALFFDVDNDGDQDLYVGNFNDPNSLFINHGDGTFSEEAAIRGADYDAQLRSMNAADINNDGWLDIYLVNMNEENMCYFNNGDGTFTNMLGFSGAFDSLVGMGSIFFDYDNDGDQDLYLTHDANGANKLYSNNGDGSFINLSVVSGLNYAGQGMGVDITDVNFDGWMDVYVTNNYDGNTLFLANGDGTYSNISQSAGIMDPGMSWGIAWTDADMDGHMDIYFANDYNFSPWTNKLYRNNGDLTFVDVAAGTPLESPYGGAGLACGDLDRNGSEDLVIAINGSGNSFDNQVLLNDLTDFQWIGIGLEGTVSNRDAIGARITVYLPEVTRHDEINCGSGYSGQNSKQLLFGLGEVTQVDSVIIRWPSGLYETYYNPEINQYHHWMEGEAPEEEIEEEPYVPPTHNISEAINTLPQTPLVVEDVDISPLLIYPNPSTGQFNLKSSQALEIEVRNLSGQLLSKVSFSGNYVLYISDWSSGNYVLRWQTQNAVGAQLLHVVR